MSGKDFSSLWSAGKMRDAIAGVAESIVERMRPSEKIGKVYSYDRLTKSADILFPGETINNLFRVSVGDHMIPSVVMQTTYASQGLNAPGDIVRIAYGAGQHYICDYVNGIPLSSRQVLVGSVTQYAGSTEPPGYFFCRGQSFSAIDYPALAAVVGDMYAVHSGTTYYLPDFNARSPIGVGGTNGKAGNANNYSLGQKWGDERLQAHGHTLNDPGHRHRQGVDASYNAAGGGASGHYADNNTGASWADGAGLQTTHVYTGITISNAGSGDMQNVHPVLGINYIIRY